MIFTEMKGERETKKLMLRSAMTMLFITFLTFAFMHSLAYARIVLWTDGDGCDIYDFIFREPVPSTIEAKVCINPDTLNLKSKGEWVTAYIELPEGYNVNNINVSSILLNNTVLDPSAPTAIGDYDGNGTLDLMVKFDRAGVISYILANVNMTQLLEERPMTITLIITGYLNDGTSFKGSDAITVIMPYT